MVFKINIYKISSELGGKRTMIKSSVLFVFLLATNVLTSKADDTALAEAMPMVSHTIIGGVVKSITWADPLKGTKSEIVLRNTLGKTIHVLVTSTTTLWDADAKAIMSSQIVPKRKINVTYLTTEEGLNIAQSIKILK